MLKPVFFAYDSIVLTDEARGILQKNVEYLKRRPSTKVMVEGHADSRGTNEYNLALTERRAVRGQGLPGQPWRGGGSRQHRGEG